MWSVVLGVTGDMDPVGAWLEATCVAGETDRMGAWSEVGIKSCTAGTDSALKAHTKSCAMQALIVRQKRMWKALSTCRCLKRFMSASWAGVCRPMTWSSTFPCRWSRQCAIPRRLRGGSSSTWLVKSLPRCQGRRRALRGFACFFNLERYR